VADKRVYKTARWLRLRLLQLSMHPLCKYCHEQGRATLAVDVDHIVPLAKGGEPYDLGNLQSLCKTCHSSVKQKEERLGERVGCDTQGIPLKGWE
jgi:5-methylcytosine-specific restriction protein A